MEITITKVNEAIAVMKPIGEINASNFIEVVDKAAELYHKDSARKLILDLSDVTGITSTGQAAIHKVALIFSGGQQDVDEGENPDFTHSGDARKYVKLFSPRPEVESALEKAGFKLFFKVYNDLESAVESFQ
jgi:anti-anti-sigma regulatory factor